MVEIKESDWKYLSRTLKDTLLNRACERINHGALGLLANTGKKAHHQLYQELYGYYQGQDKILEECFDYLKRSNAFLKLLSLYRHAIITDQELGGFSKEMQDRIKDITR